MYRAARQSGVRRRRCRTVLVLLAARRADRRRVAVTGHLCGMPRTRTRRSGRGGSAITTRHLTNAEADERSIDCSLRSLYLTRSQLSWGVRRATAGGPWYL